MVSRKRVFLSCLMVLLGAAAATLGGVGSGPVDAAVVTGPWQQGVSASGFIALGSGTCNPDALLTDCAGNVVWQLKGPGGLGFFSPYVGQWVDLTGVERTCPAGDKYLDVVTIQVTTSPCGTPTATPGGPTATPGGATPVPTISVATPTPSTGPVNLALGKPVYASSSLPGFAPEQAVDGNASTAWSSQRGYDPWAPARNVQWIYIDLGNTYSVTAMHMLWNAQRHARSYAIYAWQEWCRGWCIYASTRNGDGDDTARFPEPIEARYFMLWLVNPYLMGNAYELAEWEILGGDVAAPSGLKNVAAGKPALALNHVPGFEAPRASDADLNTDWQSLGLPVWIYVDLQGTYDVDRVVLRWTPGMHATSYALYAWNGWAWLAVYSTHRGGGGDETAVFPAVRTRWLLLYATAGPAGKVGLRELEVYERAPSGRRPLSVPGRDAFEEGRPLELDPNGVVPPPPAWTIQ